MPATLQRLFRRDRRRGQVAIFLLMLLAALAFVLLWNVDIHRIITAKSRSQNAGDAAALAGARWQGIGLNLVGELNLLHMLALSVNDTVAVDAITNVQARVLFTAPLTGVAAAQVAAKNNGMYADDGFTQLVRDHADDVRHYGDLFAGIPIFTEPYEHAWDEYADMLVSLAGDGIAAGPDNTYFYNDSIGGHILRSRAFYDAVAGKTWCWFFLNQPTLLASYTGYQWWPPLPPPTPQRVYNCEFLPLWLTPQTFALNQRFATTNRFNDVLDQAARRGVDMAGIDTTNVLARSETWYMYNTSWWGAWTQFDVNGDPPFPATGPVRPQYDYAGADAMFRVYATVNRMTPGLGGNGSTISDDILWTAAAKPFGCVGPDTDPLVPTSYGLVLPAFTDVRLIPVDTCSGSGNGTFDLEWRRHVDQHLPQYVQSGPQNNGCWFCAQLVTWENPAFRQEGIDWLAINSYRCTMGGGGGGGGTRSGGTRRGH
jgi:hypothetical protein